MRYGKHRFVDNRRGLVRQAVAWVAVLCVYVQLAAAAVCVAGVSSDAARFPICHAQSDAGHPDDHAPPAPDHSCPFCAAHCHATATLASSPGHLVRVEIASVVTERPSLVVRTVPRLVAGVSPRGPPVAA